MAALFDGIPLDRVSTSMTINATAIILLSLYIAVAKRQGVALATLSGTIQNDILKEYVARGTYIYPPRPSLRLVTDILAFGERELPNWNTISISGYHIREAGSTAVQEVAFTLRECDRVRAGGDRRPVWTSTGSASGSRSSSTRTTTSSRRSPSSAPPGGCGRGSCATGSAPRVRARSNCGSTRRPPAARSPRSSPTTTSSGSRCRRWRQCSAAPSRSTATAATRRWRCRRKTRRGSRLRTQQIIAAESGVIEHRRSGRADRTPIETLTNYHRAGRRGHPGRASNGRAARSQRSRAGSSSARFRNRLSRAAGHRCAAIHRRRRQQFAGKGDVLRGQFGADRSWRGAVVSGRSGGRSRRQIARLSALRAGRDAERFAAALDAVSRAAADGSNLVPPDRGGRRSARDRRRDRRRDADCVRRIRTKQIDESRISHVCRSPHHRVRPGRAARSRRSTTSASRFERAKPWGWSANPAAANRSRRCR